MKERRGLRSREAILMFCMLFLPSVLVVFRLSPDAPKVWWVAFIVNALVALVLVCITEDALERRGRYVDSGASWQEIWSWLKYAAPIFSCFVVILLGFAIWGLSDNVSELGLLVAMQTALTALHFVRRR